MKVALYKADTGKPLDFIINKMTGSLGYSHCELVFDKQTGLNPNFDYANAECFGISGRDNNSRYRQINLLNGRWDLFDVDLDIDEFQIYKKCQNFLNLKYDYVGIMFDWILPLGVQLMNRWYCSELTIKLIEDKITKVSPNGMSQLKYMKRIKIENLQGIDMNKGEMEILGDMECS